MPKGSIGHRWDSKQGDWNLKYENSTDNSQYDPRLSLIEKHDEVLQVEFVEYGLNMKKLRGVPVNFIKTVDGKKIPVTTVYDLTMSQYGIDRGLPEIIPKITMKKMQHIHQHGKKYSRELIQKQL